MFTITAYKVVGFFFFASIAVITVAPAVKYSCFKRHANEANGSTQSKIDPFASFACQTADNCNNSYCVAVNRQPIDTNLSID